MKGGLGQFFDDDAANEFRALSVLVEFRKLVILPDSDRRDSGADLGDFEHLCSGGHGWKLIPVARSVEEQELGLKGRLNPSRDCS